MDISAYKYENPHLNQSHEYLLPTLVKLATLNRTESGLNDIFEIGCGNGSIANSLRKLDFDLVGVDPSLEGIHTANRTYPELKLYVGSTVEDLASKFGLFSFVISLEVVEHVYDPYEFASRAFDLLKQDGLLILSTPFHGYLKNLLIALFNKWDDHFTALWSNGHIKFWSVKTMTLLLEDAGFSDLEFHFVGRLPWIAKSMVVTARRRIP